MKAKLLVMAMFLLPNLFYAQSPFNPKKGQFFEQGYYQDEEKPGNEKGVDLCIDTDIENPLGTVMVGWVENGDSDGKDFGIWKINFMGKLIWFKQIENGLDNIATGIIADPANARYLVCVRKTNTYLHGI
jgi:hypothetical protein